MALVELVREKDKQVEALQTERMQLAGQVGFLQGQLASLQEEMKLLTGTVEEQESAAPRPSWWARIFGRK
jgi:hypothetical protein